MAISYQRTQSVIRVIFVGSLYSLHRKKWSGIFKVVNIIYICPGWLN